MSRLLYPFVLLAFGCGSPPSTPMIASPVPPAESPLGAQDIVAAFNASRTKGEIQFRDKATLIEGIVASASAQGGQYLVRFCADSPEFGQFGFVSCTLAKVPQPELREGDIVVVRGSFGRLDFPWIHFVGGELVSVRH